MKIALYSKGGKYLTDSELEQWSILTEKYGVSCSINVDAFDDEFAHKAKAYKFDTYHGAEDLDKGISFIICYGGDGTLLHSIDKFGKLNIPILGVNSGRLGFLANVPKEDAAAALKALIDGEYHIEERSLMEIESEEMHSLAFNEFTLQKNTMGMINVALVVNGEYVADYMADGLIISSPSGSTAYSMSVGGAIIAPDCDCYIVNPIAPHNLNMRPIIINDNSILELSAVSRDNEVLATMDNRWFKVKNGQKFTVKKSSYKVRLVKLRNSSFYKTIREKLMWGIDIRQVKS